MEQAVFLRQLETELKQYKDRKYRINAQRFFKEKLDQPWMLKGPIFKQLAGENWQQIRHLAKRDIFVICEALLSSGLEARIGFAFDFAYRCRRDF